MGRDGFSYDMDFVTLEEAQKHVVLDKRRNDDALHCPDTRMDSGRGGHGLFVTKTLSRVFESKQEAIVACKKEVVALKRDDDYLVEIVAQYKEYVDEPENEISKKRKRSADVEVEGLSVALSALRSKSWKRRNVGDRMTCSVCESTIVVSEHSVEDVWQGMCPACDHEHEAVDIQSASGGFVQRFHRCTLNGADDEMTFLRLKNAVAESKAASQREQVLSGNVRALVYKDALSGHY